MPPSPFRFSTIVITTAPGLLAEVEDAAPDAMTIAPASVPHELDRVLKEAAVVCAVVVDAAAASRGGLLHTIRTRWLGLPTLEIGGAVALPYLRPFLRDALDQRLRLVAARVAIAESIGLHGALFETYVANVVHGVRRAELGEHLAIGEPSAQKRVRRLCRAFGVRRLAAVSQLVGMAPPAVVPERVIDALERRAVEANRSSTRVA